MRRLTLIAGVFLALAACTLPNFATGVADAVAAPPVSHANATVLDEQIGTSAELLYKGFRIGATVAVKTGIVHGASATCLRTLNNQAYGFLGEVRRAYKATNAANYKQAYSELLATVAQGTALISAKGGTC